MIDAYLDVMHGSWSLFHVQSELLGRGFHLGRH